MADGPEVSGEWDLSGTGEPPAALLRRAISHVESLLHRLDPVDATSPPAADGDPAAAAVAPPLTSAPSSSAVSFGEPSSSAQADALRTSLRAHAAIVIDAARSEADLIRRVSLVDDDNRRAELEQAVERDRSLAAAAVRDMLDDAARDADRILEQARQRALDLLTGAHASVDQVRATMRRVVETLNESLTSLDASTSSIESLLASVHAYAEPPSRSTPPRPVAPAVASTVPQFTAEQRTVASRWAEEHERRPLGLLFGTQGG